MIKPEDFKEIPDLQIVYEGILKEYQKMKDKEKKEKRDFKNKDKKR